MIRLTKNNYYYYYYYYYSQKRKAYKFYNKPTEQQPWEKQGT